MQCVSNRAQQINTNKNQNTHCHDYSKFEATDTRGFALARNTSMIHLCAVTKIIKSKANNISQIILNEKVYLLHEYKK